MSLVRVAISLLTVCLLACKNNTSSIPFWLRLHAGQTGYTVGISTVTSLVPVCKSAKPIAEILTSYAFLKCLQYPEGKEVKIVGWGFGARGRVPILKIVTISGLSGYVYAGNVQPIIPSGTDLVRDTACDGEDPKGGVGVLIRQNPPLHQPNAKVSFKRAAKPSLLTLRELRLPDCTEVDEFKVPRH